MRSFKFKSLTMRIWSTFTIIILIIVFSISLLYLVVFKKIDENAKLQDLKVSHDMLLKDGNFNNQFDKDNQFDRFGELRNLKDSRYFILNTDENNNSKIININNGHGAPLPPGISEDIIGNWMGSFINEDNLYEKEFVKSYNNSKYIFIISSINYGDTGKSYLISYIPNREDYSLIYIFIIIVLLFIAIGFITAKLVADYISKPLKELEDFTVRIAQKNWKEPIVLKNEDEIGRLANSMNVMQAQLKRAHEEEKLFLQSISHDLKTPVMVIMSHAEAIVDGIYIDSVEKTAEIIKEEAVSLEKKIKQMLYLNTLDYALENNGHNVEFNLDELISHIVSRFQLINNKIDWNCDINEIIMNGNCEKIQVAIENILENGLRYAHKEISIKLKRKGDSAVLELYNDGPNISEKHIGHIFDNLYKDSTGNFGLGLAISKKIIDFYNGEIKAVNRENGVSFIIKFHLKS